MRTPAMRTFVGFELTSAALATFAAMNWLKVQAVGSAIPENRVKYARKAVPERTIGSFPTTTPDANQKAYSNEYSLGLEYKSKIAAAFYD